LTLKNRRIRNAKAVSEVVGVVGGAIIATWVVALVDRDRGALA